MKKHLLNTFGFSMLIVVMLVAGSQVGNALPSDKDVRVVNTTAEPVPTAPQGITNIAGNVAVTNTMGVNVLNTPTVHVSAPAVQPFQAYRVFTESGTNVTTASFGTVPAGKRLVIEYVSFTGQVPPGEHVELMDISTSVGGNGAQFQMLVNPQPDAVIGDAIFRASQTVKIYADPGTMVTSVVRRSSSAGTASYGLSISGYLVDL